MKPRELLLFCFILGMGNLLFAQTSTPPGGTKETKAAKEWTILLWMAADNALEPMATATLQKLTLLAPGTTWTLVVEAARPGTGTKRFLVQRSGLQEVAAPPGGLKPLTSEALANFLAWGTKTYPAKRTALFFWGHGGGPAGFGFSETARKALSLPELQAGLSQGLAGTGAKRLDLVGFDAPRMGSYEVAQALAPSARFLLASEGTGMVPGWDWSALQVLTKTPGTSGAQLGSALLAADPAGRYRLSLVDLDKLGPIDTALRSLEAAFTPRKASLGTVVGLARNLCEPLGTTGDPTSDGQLVDMASLAARLKVTDSLGGPAQALESSVRSALVEGKSGLSLWFPTLAQTFGTADLSGEPLPWLRFLKAYFAGESAAPSALVSVDQVASGVTFLEGTVEIARFFDPAALGLATRATLTYGTSDTWNVPLFLGQRRADLSDQAVSATWNLAHLVLSQGGQPVPAFAVEDWVSEGRAYYSIPFAYYPDWVGRKEGGREAVWLAVTVDLTRGKVIDQAWFEQTPVGVLGPLVTGKEGRVVLLAKTRTSNGDWFLGERGGFFDPAVPVVCSLETLAPTGKVVLSLEIAEDGGQRQGQEFIGSLTSASSFQIYRFISR